MFISKKGWIRGKLGRPVAVMKIKRPGRKFVTIDPAHHKEAYQRFYFGDKFLSVKYLRWNIEDFVQKTIEHDQISFQEMEIVTEKTAKSKTIEVTKPKKTETKEKNSSDSTSMVGLEGVQVPQVNQQAKLKEIFTAPRYETTFKLFPDDAPEAINSPIISITQPREKSKVEEPKIKPFFTNRPFFSSLHSVAAPFMRTNSLEELEQLLAHRRESIYEGIKRMHKNARRQAHSESQNPHSHQPNSK